MLLFEPIDSSTTNYFFFKKITYNYKFIIYFMVCNFSNFIIKFFICQMV